MEGFIFRFGVNKAVLDTLDLYQEYLHYINNPYVFTDEDKMLEFKILKLLDTMGFSLTEVGTYFYKDVVIKVINILKYLDEIDVLHNSVYSSKITRRYRRELFNQLNELTSSIYFVLSKEKDLTLASFHNYIKASLVKSDETSIKMFDFDVEEFYDITYGKLAYEIALGIIKDKVSFLSFNERIVVPSDSVKKLKLY